MGQVTALVDLICKSPLPRRPTPAPSIELQREKRFGQIYHSLDENWDIGFPLRDSLLFFGNEVLDLQMVTALVAIAGASVLVESPVVSVAFDQSKPMALNGAARNRGF